MLPFTYMCFLIGSLAIMGFPFPTGFYSKELILDLHIAGLLWMLHSYIVVDYFCIIHCDIFNQINFFCVF